MQRVQCGLTAGVAIIGASENLTKPKRTAPKDTSDNSADKDKPSE